MGCGASSAAASDDAIVYGASSGDQPRAAPVEDTEPRAAPVEDTVVDQAKDLVTFPQRSDQGRASLRFELSCPRASVRAQSEI